MATGGNQDGGRGGDPAEGVGHPADLLLDEDLLERAVQPPPPSGARQVGGEDAELDRALLVRGGDVVGEAAGQLGLDLERYELVGEGAGARLDVLVRCRQAVHERWHLTGSLALRRVID